MASLFPKHLIVDVFLPSAVLAALLEHALASEADFVPTGVAQDGIDGINRRDRQSLRCAAGLGPLRDAFSAAVHARFSEFCAATGLSLFPIALTETELIAHGHGSFYSVHHDTFTQGNRQASGTDRVLSAVYYFHREPCGFSGGALALHAFVQGEPPLRIKPQQNRLVLFSAIAPHAVEPVECPSREFADSRFAVNCWLHRARPQ